MLAAKKMVVDKMHMRGHIDAWCKENCDPHKFTQLEKVNRDFILHIFTEIPLTPYRLTLKYANRFFPGSLDTKGSPKK
jgi:hypothetical protein